METDGRSTTGSSSSVRGRAKQSPPAERRAGHRLPNRRERAIAEAMLLDLGRSDPCAAARADICSRGSAGECHLALSSRCPTTECLLAHCSAVYPDSTLATCAATVNPEPDRLRGPRDRRQTRLRLREAGSGFDAEAVTMSTPWPPRHRERRLSAGGSGAGDGLHRRPEPAPRQTRPDYRSRHGSAPVWVFRTKLNTDFGRS